MNFYFEAAKILDKLDQKQDSIRGVLSGVPEKDRKRMSALIIESLKCTSALVCRVKSNSIGPFELQTNPC